MGLLEIWIAGSNLLLTAARTDFQLSYAACFCPRYTGKNSS